jgi:hypothetical protein
MKSVENANHVITVTFVENKIELNDGYTYDYNGFYEEERTLTFTELLTLLVKSYHVDLDVDNAFDLDFDDVDVYGEKLVEAKQRFCCICGEPAEGDGHNPEPYVSSDSGVCCNACELKFVLPLKSEMAEED